MKKFNWKWILTIVFALFGIVSLSQAGVISGILFLLCALGICPLVQNALGEKGVVTKKPIMIAGLIVVALAGCLTFPGSGKSKDNALTVAENVETVVETEKVTEMQSKEMEEATTETTNKETIKEEKETETEAEAQEETKESETIVEPKGTITEKKSEVYVAQVEQQNAEPIETEAITQTATEPAIEPTTEMQTEAQTEPMTEVANQDWDTHKGSINFTGHYYATKSGKCYHYSAECGGENSREITAEQASRLKPCGTCVLK